LKVYYFSTSWDCKDVKKCGEKVFTVFGYSIKRINTITSQVYLEYLIIVKISQSKD